MMDWAAIVGAGIAAAAVAYTAWNARKTKEGETEVQRQLAGKPDWVGFTSSQAARVERQDKKIIQLEEQMSDLAASIHVERELSMAAIHYLRTVFEWIRPMLPEGTQPPKPPERIMDEIADWMVGYE